MQPIATAPRWQASPFDGTREHRSGDLHYLGILDLAASPLFPGPRLAGTPSVVRHGRGFLAPLSPQEFVFQRVSVARAARDAHIQVLRIFECFQLRFLGLADRKSLIDRHIAVDHGRSLRRK